MSISTPASLEMRNAVLPFLEELRKKDAFQKVIVGVSGGGDSLALAATLFRNRGTLEIIPVVVDHGLQKNSAEIAEKAKQELIKIGFDNIFMGKAQVELIDGLEASARRARYKVFEQAMENFGSQTFFLAHTKNDQAETVLLGLMRGSGSRSLEGMRPRNGVYLRPLLEIERATTEQCCIEQGIEFWQDPHNFDERFMRVRVREKLLPAMVEELGVGVVSGLAQSAAQFQRDNDFFAIEVGKLIEKINGFHSREENFSTNADSQELKKWSCQREILRDSHPAIRTRALREIMISVGVKAEQLNYDHFEALEKLILSSKPLGPVYLPGGIWARVDGTNFLLEGSDRQ